MQGPGTECGLSIGFDAFLLSIQTNRVLFFRVSLCLCPPGQNSGISNTSITSSPPPRPMLFIGHECHPHIPAVPLTRILSPGHVELQPAASPAGTSLQKMSFNTTEGCKKNPLSHQPIVVAACKCVTEKQLK